MKLIIGILFAFNLSHAAVGASQFEFKPEAGKVEFKTKGWPNLVTIKGEGQGVIGKLAEEAGKVSGELSFDLTSLKTGIDLRDTHMKDNYLEVKTHPTAKLTLKDVTVPEKLAGSFDFTGTLNLHGQDRAVTGKAELENEGGAIKMKAEIPINLNDFKIAIPSYQGITVAEKVTINFESKVMKQ